MGCAFPDMDRLVRRCMDPSVWTLLPAHWVVPPHINGPYWSIVESSWDQNIMVCEGKEPEKADVHIY